MERYKKASNLGTVMRSIFILLVLLIIFLPVLASAATYYVDRDSLGGSCSDSNAGTALSAPLCTIRQVNRMVQAGDTVLVRTGTYTESDGSAVIRPWSSGAPNNYITYKNYNGEHVILTGVYQPISLTLGSYIQVEGFDIDGSASNPNALVVGAVMTTNYNVIANCTIHDTIQTDSTARGVWIRGASHHNQILGNYIHHIGKPVTVSEQWGDGIVSDYASGYNLIEGNRFDYCGRGSAGVWGRRNVVRNNDFSGHWGGSFGVIDPFSITDAYQVVENNIIRDVEGIGVSGVPQPGLGITGPRRIVRKNVVYQISGSGMEIIAGYPIGASYDKVYNNVIFRAGQSKVDQFDHGIDFTTFEGPGITGVELVNNIFRDNTMDGISWRDLANPDLQVIRNNWWQVDGDPRFVNENSYNFNLQADSPAIDNGDWLTSTVSASSGTSIPVVDASYFIDGFA